MWMCELVMINKDKTVFIQLDQWSFTHVLREKNKVADKLAGEGRLKG